MFSDLAGFVQHVERAFEVSVSMLRTITRNQERIMSAMDDLNKSVNKSVDAAIKVLQHAVDTVQNNKDDPAATEAAVDPNGAVADSTGDASSTTVSTDDGA